MKIKSKLVIIHIYSNGYGVNKTMIKTITKIRNNSIIVKYE